MARITIGIAAGDNADAHRLAGDKIAAVTDPFAGTDFLHSQNAAFQRHHRLQAQAGGILVGEGAAPVEDQTGTHPVPRGFRIAQHGGRIVH